MSGQALIFFYLPTAYSHSVCPPFMQTFIVAKCNFGHRLIFCMVVNNDHFSALSDSFVWALTIFSESYSIKCYYNCFGTSEVESIPHLSASSMIFLLIPADFNTFMMQNSLWRAGTYLIFALLAGTIPLHSSLITWHCSCLHCFLLETIQLFGLLQQPKQCNLYFLFFFFLVLCQSLLM